jgi:hypothetical protein
MNETKAEHEADSLNDAVKSDALNNGPRYCEDCRHFEQSATNGWLPHTVEALNYSRCAATRVIKHSLVSPKLDAADSLYCKVTRMPGGICGPEGKLWELRSVVELTERFRSESGIE